jgi:CBS domain-containing protein
MRLADVLRSKKQKIVSIAPGSTVIEVVDLMKSEQVGAVVVLDNDLRLQGLISERDVVLGLSGRGSVLLDLLVGDVMMTDVPVARPEDSVQQIMQTMTLRRVRHMPVVSDGMVAGIVSIGDIVKSRLAEKIEENSVLQDIARLRLAAS